MVTTDPTTTPGGTLISQGQLEHLCLALLIGLAVVFALIMVYTLLSQYLSARGRASARGGRQ